MGERITQTELARRFGVSQQAISRHVRSGLLPTVDRKIDVDIAGRILGKCLDPERSKILRNSMPEPAPAKSPATDEPLQRLVSGERMSFEQARTVEKRYQALAAKAAYEERMGSLVPISAIEPAMAAAIVSAREHLLACSRKLARDVQGLGIAEAAAVIDAAHAEVLRRLSQWRPGDAETDEEDLDPAVSADPFDGPHGA